MATFRITVYVTTRHISRLLQVLYCQ